ncbi:MAG: ABC transporter permease subunit [Clostridia bacterium]|nr:ABC transporter permease subunit [Clostridia bacterium]
MKSLLSFTKKEFMEHFRSAKIIILTGVFILFAIINPMIAKFTPVIIEMLSESMQGGMEITAGEVTAMDSWLQFIKNAPMALIVFMLLESSIFTKEYQKGTLVLTLTKGLKRHTVLISKTFVMLTLWTAEYFMCYGLTYLFNNILWDNTVAENLTFMALNWWILGVMAICLSVLFSVIAKNNILVLAGTGGVILGSYLIGSLPKIGDYMPTLLMNSNPVIYGLEEVSHYIPAIIIAVSISVISVIVSVPIFNKKHI